MTPRSATVNPDTYWVVTVEHPAVSAFVGQAFLVETYSLMDVLHEALATTASDIFERIT